MVGPTIVCTSRRVLFLEIASAKIGSVAVGVYSYFTPFYAMKEWAALSILFPSLLARIKKTAIK
jgi:hypothetical protein